MKYCSNCGSELKKNAKFCTNCGVTINLGNSVKPTIELEDKEPIEKPKNKISSPQIAKINNRITLENNQSGIVKGAWYVAGFFLLIIILAFMNLDVLPIHPALAFLSFFFFLSSVVIGFMFRGREKKLQKLISGDSLIAEWTLSSVQKEAYANYFFKQESGRNKAIFYLIAFIAAIVFGIFILLIDKGKLFMFLVYIGLLIFLAIFAYGMPFYYKIKNSKGDGNILIGAKYAYINGYFHNWDFPLSGLSKIKIINEPFYGIYVVYYYTDRTLSHSEEIYIPSTKNIDLEALILKFQELNN